MTFIGDSELIVPVKVISRTAKTVKIEINSEVRNCRVKNSYYDNEEFIQPEGNYSMAPTCYARKTFN